MITPFTICCHSVARFSCVRRLKIRAKTMTPMNVPTMVARPPARLVPPITVAPIASSSRSSPETGEALASRPHSSTAASPARRPERQ